MFRKIDQRYINSLLEKAQRCLQEFRTDSEPLQELWQEVIQVQVHLDRIEVEEEKQEVDQKDDKTGTLGPRQG